jgi:hypothetical protein
MQRFEKQRLAHLLGVVVLQQIARLLTEAAFPEKTHSSSLLIKKNGGGVTRPGEAFIRLQGGDPGPANANYRAERISTLRRGSPIGCCG